MGSVPWKCSIHNGLNLLLICFPFNTNIVGYLMRMSNLVEVRLIVHPPTHQFHRESCRFFLGFSLFCTQRKQSPPVWGAVLGLSWRFLYFKNETFMIFDALSHLILMDFFFSFQVNPDMVSLIEWLQSTWIRSVKAVVIRWIRELLKRSFDRGMWKLENKVKCEESPENQVNENRVTIE